MSLEIFGFGHDLNECIDLSRAGAKKTALVLVDEPAPELLSDLTLGEVPSAICIPPYCGWNWEAWVRSNANELRGHLVLSENALGKILAGPPEIDEANCSLLTTPIEYDEEVGLAEWGMEQFPHASSYFVSVGTGTSQPLVDQLRDAEQFPEWAYLTRAQLERLTTSYRIWLGGNLPWSDTELLASLVPKATRGVFVMTRTGFNSHYNNIFGAMDTERCIDMIGRLSTVFPN